MKFGHSNDQPLHKTHVKTTTQVGTRIIQDRAWIRHEARKAGIAQRDLRTAIEKQMTSGTIKDAIDAVRNGTLRQHMSKLLARTILDEAIVVADKMFAKARKRMPHREDRQPTVQARLDRAVRNRIWHDYRNIGSHYSGNTEFSLRAAPIASMEIQDPAHPDAKTTVTDGEWYAGRRWSKTDAQHSAVVRLSGLRRVEEIGIPLYLPADNEIVTAAATTGTPGVYRIDVITSRGKQVAMQRGLFVVEVAPDEWHIANTERGCATARKRREEDDAVRHSIANSIDKIDSRVMRHLGWCQAGIRNWCKQRNVTRDLDRRLRKGAPIKAVARLVQKQGGPRTAYDRRIIAFAEQA